MDTLIDRYLAAVSENLPAKQRNDTVTEIRSLIQDALDDRSKAEGRPPDDEMMAEVLKQFGSPEKIVAPYLPEKYLIGPRLFTPFITVVRIVLPIIAVLSLVGFWVGFNQGDYHHPARADYQAGKISWECPVSCYTGVWQHRPDLRHPAVGAS